MDLNLSGVLLGAFTLVGAVITALVTLRKVKADRDTHQESAASKFLDQLVAQIDELRDEVAVLRAHLNDYRAQEGRLRQELDNLEQDNERLRKRVRVLEQKLQSLPRLSPGDDQ